MAKIIFSISIPLKMDKKMKKPYYFIRFTKTPNRADFLFKIYIYISSITLIHSRNDSFFFN